ncbi:MAG TPA: phosphoenolpyruvate carboxykinase (ATP), partial [Anaerolineales bacterium]|nr:phosphoenolpyruvate carboxykinase (ATP) [Anaerolineales bacterium]
VFGFEVPRTCPDVPSEVLEPWSSWPNREEYDKKYKQLAQKFIENFAKFESETSQEVIDAGPKV